MKVKLHKINSPIRIGEDSFSIISANLVTAKITHNTTLNSKSFKIMSNGILNLSRYLFTKEYQPQKAMKRMVAIFEGSIRSERNDDAKYTPRAEEVPNSIRINVTTKPQIAHAV